jgi:hypothetical protein
MPSYRNNTGIASVKDRRTPANSGSAGMSVAYVFVHVMNEMVLRRSANNARRTRPPTRKVAANSNAAAPVSETSQLYTQPQNKLIMMLMHKSTPATDIKSAIMNGARANRKC